MVRIQTSQKSSYKYILRSWVQQINSDQKAIKSYVRKHAFLTDYLQQQKSLVIENIKTTYCENFS